MSKIIFFTGKGGSGKSTVSSLTSLYLSKENKKTVLVSLDPAHNLSHIFKKKFGERAKKINKYLYVKEVNEQKQIKKYLKDTELLLKKTYSYQTAFNLESYFHIIKYSPAMEEYGLLVAFKEVVNNYKDFDYLLFDMPPTALTLKFFRLPTISLLWIKKLKELRQKIVKKKSILSKVKNIKLELQRDKVLQKLNQVIEDYYQLEKLFQNKKETSINIIINNDDLSYSEYKLIKEKLKEIKIKNHRKVINRVDISDKKDKRTDAMLAELHIAPVGMDNLNLYLEKNSGEFEKIVF